MFGILRLKLQTQRWPCLSLAPGGNRCFRLAGVLAYEVLAGKPLMAPRSKPEEVEARLAGLALMDMAPIDLQLQPVLRSMLSPAVSQRPAVSTFTGSPYFQVRVVGFGFGFRA